MRITLQIIMNSKYIKIALLVIWLFSLGLALLLTIQPYPFFWKTVSLASQSVQIGKQGAHIYVISPGKYEEASSAKLFEDGKAMGPENALRIDIGAAGGGRYCFEKGRLFFSSSDNSDPRINGRIYTLALPRPIAPRWVFLIWGWVIALAIVPFGIIARRLGLIAGRYFKKEKLVIHAMENQIKLWVATHPHSFLGILAYGMLAIMFLSAVQKWAIFWVALVVSCLFWLIVELYGQIFAQYEAGWLSGWLRRREEIYWKVTLIIFNGLLFLAFVFLLGFPKTNDINFHNFIFIMLVLNTAILEGLFLRKISNAQIKKLTHSIRWRLWGGWIGGGMVITLSLGTVIASQRLSGDPKLIWLVLFGLGGYLYLLYITFEGLRNSITALIKSISKRISPILVFNDIGKSVLHKLSWLHPFAFWGIPILLYLILYYSHIDGMKLIVVFFNSNPSLICILMIPLFYVSLRINNWYGSILNLILISFLFASSLIVIWMQGGSGGTYLGGFLPFSDANGYYSSAETLNRGYLLNSWSTRRPIFHAFLSSLFFLAGKKWVATLILLSILIIYSSYFSLKEIRKYFGAEAASVYIVIIYMFFRQYIGSTLSENLGIILGLLSMAVIIRGIFTKKIFIVSFGVFLLSLGLNARAGAFFVLPLILLWSWFFFTSGEKYKVKTGKTFLLLVAIIGGFLINSLLINWIGSPDKGIPFGNFAAVLYGLVFGGDWTLYQNNPALQGLVSERELWNKTYSIVFLAIKDNPTLLLSGALRAWMYFLANGFPFIYFYDRTVRMTLLIFSGYSLILMIFTRSHIARFLLACAIGIWFSVPFAPPWDSGGMRVYATTIPLLAMFPAFGIYKSLELINRLMSGDKQRLSIPPLSSERKTWRSNLLIFSIVIVLLCFPFPIILQRVNAARNTNLMDIQLGIKQSGDLMSVQLHDPNNFLNIVPDNVKYSMVPNVRKKDFFENSNPIFKMYPETLEVLKTNLNENMSLKFDPFIYRWIIIDTRLLQKGRGIFETENIRVKNFEVTLIRSENNHDESNH